MRFQSVKCNIMQLRNKRTSKNQASYKLEGTLLENVESIKYLGVTITKDLTHISLASLLWDIGKQNSPRCDAAERGVPSRAILFAWRNFIEK